MMYLAVWIDGQPRSKPFERLNSAIIALNSDRLRPFDGMVFSGEARDVERFWDNVDPRCTDPQEIAELAARHNLSDVQYDALARVKMPKVGYYPRYTTPRGKKLWDEIMKEHRDTLKRYKKPEERWGAAIILFRRAAADRNIQPFTRMAHEATRRKVRGEINRRANRGNLKALNAIQRAADRVGISVQDERFHESAHHNGLYYITTRVQSRSKRKNLIDELIGVDGWMGVRDYAHLPIDAYTDILAEPKPSGLVFYVATMMTEDQVILLFELPEDVSSSDALRALEVGGRRWVKTGKLF